MLVDDIAGWQRLRAALGAPGRLRHHPRHRTLPLPGADAGAGLRRRGRPTTWSTCRSTTCAGACTSTWSSATARSTSRRCCGPWPTPATAAWSRSSCPAHSHAAPDVAARVARLPARRGTPRGHEPRDTMPGRRTVDGADRDQAVTGADGEWLGGRAASRGRDRARRRSRAPLPGRETPAAPGVGGRAALPDAPGWTADDAARALLLAALPAGPGRGRRPRPSTATATRPRSGPCCAALPLLPVGAAGGPAPARRHPHQRHPAGRRRARPLRRGTSTTPPGGRRCSSACSWACRWPPWTGSTSAPTPSWPRCSPGSPRSAPPPAASMPADAWPCSTRALTRRLTMRIFDPHIHMTSRTTDDYERMAAAGVRAAGGAGLLAGPAPHQRRVVRRLLRLAGRLGAVPGRPVRHPPPRHDRAEPEGGQRPALPARCSTCCRATWTRTAWSRSARSATTR